MSWVDRYGWVKIGRNTKIGHERGSVKSTYDRLITGHLPVLYNISRLPNWTLPKLVNSCHWSFDLDMYKSIDLALFDEIFRNGKRERPCPKNVIFHFSHFSSISFFFPFLSPPVFEMSPDEVLSSSISALLKVSLKKGDAWKFVFMIAKAQS